MFSLNPQKERWRRIINSPIFLALFVAFLSVILGRQIGQGGQSAFIDLISLAGGAVLLWIALNRPVWGLAFTLAAIPIVEPVTDLFPNLPFLTSIIAGIGAVTVVGFIIQVRWDTDFKFQFKLFPQYVWAALFIGWIVATNPGAAVFGSTRNWLWTLIQLAILLFLCSVLLTSARNHKIVMACFAVTATLSALFALITGIPEGTTSLGGLSGGANAAARYFLVGFVFLNYLQQTTNRPVIRLVYIAGSIIALAGVIASGSRTGGFLAVFVLLFIIVAGRLAARQRWILPFILGGVIVALLLPEQVMGSITSSILSFQEGTDTIQKRYLLWQAGYRMWSDFPVQGVGIGEFQVLLPRYGADLLPADSLGLGAHNTYMAVLSETGLVGLLLFLGLLGYSLAALWRAYQLEQPPLSAIAFTWLLVFLVLAIGGLTKHDHYEKVMWATMGVAAGMMGYLRPGAGRMLES